MKRFLLLILFAIVPALNAAQNTDADFSAVAEEFIKGYLNARPLLETRLGFHEYDGRISEYTRLAIDAELARLKRFDERLKKFDIIPEYSFVLGTPAPTPEEVEAQIDFEIGFIKKIKRINPGTEIILYTYSPVATEGSDLYNQALAKGFRCTKQFLFPG
jgi:hypothetical protein